MNEIYCGDIRDIAKILPDQSVNCIVTSPPYFGLRDYGVDNQIGLEATPEAYVNTLVGIFRELKRVLRDDGTIWLNLGDSYAKTKIGNTNEAPDKRPRPYFENGTHQMNFKKTIPDGMKPKNLIGIPWRVAFALQADGWILRSDIIWHKKNPMPESVTDRPTKAHEYIFLLSKKPRYYYDNEAVREQWADKRNGNPGKYTPYYQIGSARNDGNQIGANGNWDSSHLQGRNRRSVWSISTRPYKSAHFAVFPPDLIRPCILAGCPQQVCGECGEPWKRVIEKSSVPRDLTLHRGKSKWAIGAKIRNDTDLTRSGQEAAKWKAKNPDRFLGFSHTCQCCPLPANKSATRPGVVLDPFMGSGTVAQVAIETGRNWLGVELNPEYIELANKRIAQTQPALPIEITL